MKLYESVKKKGVARKIACIAMATILLGTSVGTIQPVYASGGNRGQGNSRNYGNDKGIKEVSHVVWTYGSDPKAGMKFNVTAYSDKGSPNVDVNYYDITVKYGKYENKIRVSSRFSLKSGSSISLTLNRDTTDPLLNGLINKITEEDRESAIKDMKDSRVTLDFTFYYTSNGNKSDTISFSNVEIFNISEMGKDIKNVAQDLSDTEGSIDSHNFQTREMYNSYKVVSKQYDSSASYDRSNIYIQNDEGGRTLLSGLEDGFSGYSKSPSFAFKAPSNMLVKDGTENGYVIMNIYMRSWNTFYEWTLPVKYTLNPSKYTLGIHDYSKSVDDKKDAHLRTKPFILQNVDQTLVDGKSFLGWDVIATYNKGDTRKLNENYLSNGSSFIYGTKLASEDLTANRGLAKNIDAYAIYKEIAPSITITDKQGYDIGDGVSVDGNIPSDGAKYDIYVGDGSVTSDVKAENLANTLKSTYENNKNAQDLKISIVKKSTHDYGVEGEKYIDSDKQNVTIKVDHHSKQNFNFRSKTVKNVKSTEGVVSTGDGAAHDVIKNNDLVDAGIKNVSAIPTSCSVSGSPNYSSMFSIEKDGTIKFTPNGLKVLRTDDGANIKFTIQVSKNDFNDGTIDFTLNLDPYSYGFKKLDITSSSQEAEQNIQRTVNTPSLGSGNTPVESGDYKGMNFDHWSIYGKYDNTYTLLDGNVAANLSYNYGVQSESDIQTKGKFADEILAAAVYKQPTPSVSITVDNKNKNGEVTVTGLKEGANYKIIDNSGKSKKSTDADKSYTSVELEEAMKKNPESFKDKDIILLAPEVSLIGYRGIGDFSFLESDKGQIEFTLIEKESEDDKDKDESKDPGKESEDDKDKDESKDPGKGSGEDKDKDDTKDPGKGSGEDKDDTKNPNKPEDNKPNGGGSTYIENKDKDKDKDGLDKEPQTAPGKTNPISGKDRYETAVEASKKNFDKADTVVLVNGKAPVDALTSTNLAYEKKAPILLSRADSVPDVTLAEIQRLGAKNIILIGGENTLNSSVVSKLQSLRLAVDRVGGVDRYDTASKIVDRLYSGGYVSTSAMLVSGQNFIDALSIAGNAAYTRVPVLLVKKNSLTSFTEASLAKYHLNEVSIIGGSDSVGEAVRSILGKSNIKISKTIAGLDRYETSSGFAKATLASKKAYLASGVNISDALVIGPVAAKDKASILITRKSKLPKSIREVIEKGNFSDITIVGGSDSVDEDILD